MAIVIPASCGGGGSEDTPQPQPTPQPTPTPEPTPLPDISGLDNLKSFQVDVETDLLSGIIFNIPGAEVLIDGQWIAYSDNNKDLFLTQNPMTLQWRLNSDLLRKTGYKQGDTLPGQILVVDDQWRGLNISTDFSIKIE